MSQYEFETKLLHAGYYQVESAFKSRSVPIYQTTSFVFDDCAQAQDRFNLAQAGNIYTRLTNPTVDVFEQRVAQLEGGVGAVATASGMSAVYYSIKNLVSANDHIISASNIYGGSYNLIKYTFAQEGVSSTFVDIDDHEGFQAAIKPNTKCIFIETLSNPNSKIGDIEAIAKIANLNRIPLIVDNTFASPYLLRPFEYGANIVVHSATKLIGGSGNSVGGIIVDGGNFEYDIEKFPHIAGEQESYHNIKFENKVAYISRIRTVLLRDIGACISPFNAWLFLQGIETLSLRIDRHRDNALKVVEFLKNHPAIVKVNHPSLDNPEVYEKYYPDGAGFVFTFEINGDEAQTKKFIDSLELFSLLANIGDSRSLVIHPASTTHSQLSHEELELHNIKANTVRVSIGLENIRDILKDLGKALSAIQ